jgi:hypothetical protein
MKIGKISSSATTDRLVALRRWCWLVGLVLAVRSTTAFVTIESTPAPTAAPAEALEGGQYGNGSSQGAAFPTSAPTILEVPDSFTKEPIEGVFDDDDDQADSNNTNSSTTPNNSTDADGGEGGGGGEAAPPGPDPSPPSAPSSTTTSSSTGSRETSGSGGGLSTGAVIGIAFGCGIAVGLLLSLAFVYVRRGKVEQQHSSAPGTLEVKQFSTTSSPNRKTGTAAASETKTPSSSSSSSKGSKGTADADADEEDGSDCPDPTEHSCTVSSSRGSDDALLLSVAVSHPSYAQYALRALEEEDETDVILECEV